MRERAEEADIVIVNHHLFFADLNVRGNQYGKVLPDYGAVIFDEAHLIEDIAADYFGFQISSFQIDELVRDADRSADHRRGWLPAILTKLCAKIIGLADQFWIRFTQVRTGKTADFRSCRMLLPKKLETAMLKRHRSAKHISRSIPRSKDWKPALTFTPKKCPKPKVFSNEFAKRVSISILSANNRRKITFIGSKNADAECFCARRRLMFPTLLQEKLFDKTETVVLTSATLSSNGKFDFIKDRFGLDDPNKTETLLAPSAFDYQKQAIIYIPKAMPDPRAPEFNQMAAGEIIKIINITKGHAFVLCTSNYSMNALYELVSMRVNFPCFVQGSMSKAGILERFKSTKNAVLFATSSFWQGVDVRGEQLSCVIIDKLPFAVPCDPIVAARTKFIDENGGKSFFDYSVPQAVISLKQGIGRLIRSKTDKGVIAILDTRLRTKSYGRDFLNSLPKTKITSELKDVAEMFDGGEKRPPAERLTVFEKR